MEALTIDSASALLIINPKVIRLHPTLSTADIKRFSCGSFDLRSAENSPIKVVGFIRFDLTFDGKTLPVECFVSGHSDPDYMLVDSSLMGAFRSILDWVPETLSFRIPMFVSKAHTRDGTSKVTLHAGDMTHVPLLE